MANFRSQGPVQNDARSYKRHVQHATAPIKCNYYKIRLLQKYNAVVHCVDSIVVEQFRADLEVVKYSV